MEKVSVVIPMYRSEGSISAVVAELNEKLLEMKGYSYEIILVNDFSPDNVFEIAKSLAKKSPYIKVVNLAKNVGQENAMFAGYHCCTGDYIVSMDDDMQHPAGAIPIMLDALISQDMDVVFADFDECPRSFLRRIGSRLHWKMEEIVFSIPKTIKTNSFFIMRKLICDKIKEYTYTKPHIYGVIFGITHHVTNVKTIRRQRMVGKSNYKWNNLFGFFWNGLMGFSTKPLRIFTILGICITFFSLIAILIIIAIVLAHDAVAVPGWASTVVLLMFFAGIQLISAGLISEYIGRIYISNSHIPNFTIREVFYEDKTTRDGKTINLL